MYLLQSKIAPQVSQVLQSVPLSDIDGDDENIMNNIPKEDDEEANQPVSMNRYSYRAAIYSNGDPSGDIG